MAKKRNGESHTGMRPTNNSRLLRFIIDPTVCPLLKAFVLSGANIIATLALVPVRYEVNDDPAIVAILSGLGGMFPAHYDTVFLNPLTSYLLYELYALAPGTPWYGITVFFSLFWGMALFFFIFLRYSRGVTILLCVPALVFFFHMLSFVSFTSASLMLEFAVFLCAFSWAVDGSPPVRNVHAYTAILVFGITLAILLRWKLVLCFLAFGIPVILYLQTLRIRRTIIPAMFILAIVLATAGCDYIQKSRGSGSYFQYNDLRSQFLDTYKGDYYEMTTPFALFNAGWKPIDYLVFQKMKFLYDDQIFNSESLSTFLAFNKPPEKNAFLKNALERMSSHITANREHLLILIIVIISLGMHRYKKLQGKPGYIILRHVIFLVMVSAGFVFFLCYRFPYRVSLPLCAYVLGLFYVMFNCGEQKPGTGNNLFINSFIAILLVSSLICAHSLVSDMLSGLRGSEERREELVLSLQSFVNKTACTNTYLVPVQASRDCLIIDFSHPLREVKDYQGLRIMPTGWMVHTPYYYNALASLGIQNGRALLKWMINHDDVIFFHLPSKDSAQIIRLLELHLSLHAADSHEVRLIPKYGYTPDGGMSEYGFYKLVCSTCTAKK